MPIRASVRITAHTIEEGGIWIVLDKAVLVSQRVLRESLTAFPIGSVELAGLVVHSIRTNKGKEWDIYNGWREKDGNSKSES